MLAIFYILRVLLLSLLLLLLYFIITNTNAFKEACRAIWYGVIIRERVLKMCKDVAILPILISINNSIADTSISKYESFPSILLFRGALSSRGEKLHGLKTPPSLSMVIKNNYFM